MTGTGTSILKLYGYGDYKSLISATSPVVISQVETSMSYEAL